MIGYRPWPLVKISWLFLTPGLCLVGPYPLSPSSLQKTWYLRALPSLSRRAGPRPSLFSWVSPPSAFCFSPLSQPYLLLTGLFLSVLSSLNPCSPPSSVPVADGSTELSYLRCPSVWLGAPLYLAVGVKPGEGLSGSCLTLPLSILGHLLLLLEQVHTSQVQQCLHVSFLGILHWMALGFLLHGLCPTVYHHHPPEDPGLLQEGRWPWRWRGPSEEGPSGSLRPRSHQLSI